MSACQACPHCQNTEQQVKAGRTEAKSQRYLCKACQRRYTPEPKQAGYGNHLRRQTARLYVDGMNFRLCGHAARPTAAA
ncbi:MAG: IS1/IS1595 family N-terminal zinc-binding domain-containing protein [Aggregatilineales bacterium]